MGDFKFKQFTVRQEQSALKVGTDAVLLGASMTLKPGDRRLLDIGTGTGVIALMAAQRSSARIEAIDIDRPSVEESERNFEESPWADRLNVFLADLRCFVPEEKYDVIFSNPPFFEDSLKNPDVRESVARHTDNLSYRDICSFASRNLVPEGRMSLILPADKEASLVRLSASFGLYPFRFLRIRTTPGKATKRIIAEFSRDRGPVTEKELTLQKGSERSVEYSDLTKEYYL